MFKHTPLALYAFIVNNTPFLIWVLFFVLIINENNLSQTKIVPIGNSITQGDANREGANSYRRDLWNLLTDAGYNVDFVGSEDSPINGSHPDTNFDHDHEGHYGWRADEIKDDLAGWLTEYETPDIALIHLGTNDIRDDQTTSSTINDISDIIDILRIENPNITIFLAQIIPSAGWIDDGGTQINSLNQALIGFVSTKSTGSSPVILVDHHTGWDVDVHCYDDIHPNEAGEARMAQTWFDALNDYLTPCISPSINLTETNVSCNGGSDGIISAFVSGGRSPYNLIWSNGGTGNQINFLQAGSYSVTVTDDIGCAAIKSTSIGEPSQLTATIVINHESIQGAHDGDIDLLVEGGTPGYLYSWSNGASTQDINNLEPGNYSVTISDNNGCTQIESATINEGSPDCSGFSVSINPTNISCYGDNNGSAEAIVSGGSPAYSFDWSNGNENQQINGLAPGNYLVTVTDNNYCTAQASATINEPDELTASATATPESIVGAGDGSINLSVSGGTGDYDFIWNNGATTEDLSGLIPGIYSVTVTDENGCEEYVSATVGSPDCSGLSVSIDQTHISCFGLDDGSAIANVSGGASGYLFDWSNGGNTQQITSLEPGNYSVTVTDNNNCTAQASATINEPDELTASATATPESTVGAGDGSINLTTSGGTGDYDFIWNNDATSEDISGLIPGTYSVTITDENGCEEYASAIVGSPDCSSFSVNIDPTHISCYGLDNGTAIANVSGGQGTPSFDWSNGGKNQQIDELAPGNYSVTATDGNNCTAQASTTISEPIELTASATATPESAVGADDGSIDLNVSGGTGDYDFIWNNGATTEDISGLIPGTYSVTVTDENGCEAFASATVGSPDCSGFSVSIDKTDISCYGNDNGTAEAIISGGSPNFSFDWSNGDNDQQIIELEPGNYSVDVTDDNGCTAQASTTIIEPAQLEASAVATDESTVGAGNGSVNLTVSGGTGDYDFIWTNDATTEDINGLIPNTYSVTVTDENGCQDITSATVGSPDCSGFSVSINKTDITCYGNDNGTAEAIVSGGSPSYSFDWSNNGNQALISDLPPGSYSVEVTDGNGCTVQASTTISEPVKLNASATAMPELAVGAGDGSINLDVSGGTGDYDFIWNNGATTEDLSGLIPGTYSVTVTDENGCEEYASATVGSPDCSGLSVSIDPTHITCFGSNDGSAIANASGGQGTPSYDWSNGSNNQQITNPAPGNYSVTVTDGNNCSAQTSTTISEPDELTASASASPESAVGAGDGSIDLSASGGTGDYDFIWSNGATTEDINSLAPGTYSVTVTDENGCETSASAIVGSPDCSGFSVSIDPTHITCFGFDNGTANAVVAGGSPAYAFDWSNGSNNQQITNLAPGNYSVTVTDGNNCSAQASTIISEPAELTASASASPESAVGAGDGSIDLSASGSTGDYDFIWSNGATTEDINSLAPGTYSVTVTDENGCEASASAIVGSPDCSGFSVSIIKTDVSCFNGNDGKAEALVNGAQGSVSYAWTNGQNDPAIENLTQGDYSVQVTDELGCTASATTVINEPLQITIEAVLNHESELGENNGAIDLSIAGGTQPYSFSWSNGSTSQNLEGLPPGTYTITVVDDNSCMTQNSYEIDEGPLVCDDFKISTTHSGLVCYGDNNANAYVNASGGKAPYSFVWSGGETDQFINGLSAGLYTVLASDYNGCQTQDTVIIAQPQSLQISAQVNHETELGQHDGSIDLTVTGGTLPYSYAWSNNSTTKNIADLSPAAYSVTVTDDNSCQKIYSTVINPGNLNCDDFTLALEFSHVTCYGLSDGNITSIVSGGSQPYSYNWSNGASSEDLANIGPGNYSLILTDAFGCEDIKSVSINEPDELNTMLTTNHESTLGANDGSINLAVNGGISPYSYKWSNELTTQNLNNLTPGKYKVTVTDQNNCLKYDSSIVNQGEPDCSELTINFTETNISCFGQSNGSITTNVSGGKMPFTYTWSNGAQTPDLSNLIPGDYKLTVTDNYGCVDTQTVSITQPETLDISLSPTHESELGAQDGKINLTVSGGIPPYFYSWSNGSNDQDIDNLPPDTYHVTVTDNNYCLINDSTRIDPGTPDCSSLVLSLNKNDISCNGLKDGSISSMVTGGQEPYVYEWSNGQNSSNNTDLLSGEYWLNVKDQNNCEITDSIYISEPDILNIQSNVNHATDTNIADGNINLTITGGNPPYSFVWSNGSTTKELSNLAVGEYQVTVTDANNCMAYEQFNILSENSECFEFSLHLNKTDVSCYGMANGSIETTVTGGSSPYNFYWSNGAVNEVIDSLQPGTYALTVTDVNDCIVTDSVQINQPAELDISISVNHESMRGLNDGSISLTTYNGVAPYSFLWSNGKTNQSIDSLSPGSYNVTVTDNNECVANASVKVNQGILDCSGFSMLLQKTDITCYGFNDGTAQIDLRGAQPPFSIEWSNGNTTDSVSNLTPGKYSVTITSKYGCKLTDSIQISEPEQFEASMEITDESSLNAEDGSIELIYSGGTPSYSFLWSNLDTADNINNLSAGLYSVTISDENNCTESIEGMVGSSLTMGISHWSTSIKVFPNPANHYLFIDGLNDMNSNNITIELFSLNGVKHNIHSAFANNDAIIILNVSDLPKGMYILRIKTPNASFSTSFTKE